MVDTFDDRQSRFAAAIRYLQERVLIFALAVAFIATGASFWSLGRAGAQLDAMQTRVDDLNEEVAVYQIYVQNLHAELKARGFAPPPLPEETHDEQTP